MRQRTSASTCDVQGPQIRAMRAVALAAILLAGCTAGTGAPPSVATPVASASPTPAAALTARPSTASPAASPPPATAYTGDDVEIAKLITSGAETAIPQLMVLNDSDPSRLEDIFLPLGVWIASQKAGVASFSASSCTSAAVARFNEGMDRYDAIRKLFLAWRDWGAQGHAFPPGAPRQAHESFDQALAELKAHCPT